MKKLFVACLLFVLMIVCISQTAWAIDVGWMQTGVRVWYFGAVGSTSASDAEEAYLFSAVNGTDAQVTKHAGSNHWASTQPIDTTTYSFLDKGPCWIHPQVLATISTGGAAKLVRVPPIEMLTNSVPSVPYISLRDRLC